MKHLKKFNESNMIKEELSYEYGTVSNLELRLIDIFEEILPPMIYYGIKVNALWEGIEYDAIGQWTDKDIENKLSEIF